MVFCVLLDEIEKKRISDGENVKTESQRGFKFFMEFDSSRTYKSFEVSKRF